MNHYDLSKSEELGRLAQLITKLVGPDANFVFAFSLNNKDEKGSGAISNVDPAGSAQILTAALLQFIDQNDFEEVTLTTN